MRSLVLIAITLAAGATGCDKDLLEDLPPDAGPIDARESGTNSTCTATGTPGGTHRMFLQFEGQTIIRGAIDDATTSTSFIGGGTIPPWQPALPNRAQRIQFIVDDVNRAFAPYDVEVVTTRPASGPYAMMVIGGLLSDIGVAGEASGISNFSCGVIPSSIAFVFDIPDFNTYEIAQLIIAAMGLGYGVSSSDEPGECMCWSGPSCEQWNGATPCVVGGVNTPTPGDQCPGGVVARDMALRFEQVFGCRP